MEADYGEGCGGCGASDSCTAPVCSDLSEVSSSASDSHPRTEMKNQKTQPQWNRSSTKSRVKSSSRRMFLDCSFSDVEVAGNAGGRGVLDTFAKENPGDDEYRGDGNEGTYGVDAEQESSPMTQTLEDSWMCPLTFDDLPTSEGETEGSTSGVRSKNPPGMILKLRRMLSGGFNRKRALYQAVPAPGTFTNLPQSDGEGVSSGTRTPAVTHRWQTTGSFSHTLRPIGSSSIRKRRRWVLRSAVQRAHGVMMRVYYPDLVGKKIRHLYEEDDKSEVWYRGEVLRVHEAHANPLKTIFEVRYDSEPEWKYYLELLMDYKKGWLKIED